MKKKKIISFVLCGFLAVFILPTVFGTMENNKGYKCTIDFDLTDFKDGKHWIQKVTYDNGETTTINPVDRFTFLMINNNFVPNVDIKNVDGHSLVSIRLISEELGGQVRWDPKKNAASIEYKNNKIMMNAGNRNVTINGKITVPSTASQIINGRMYVPLRAVTEAFGVDINYNVNGIMPFGNPLISIDSREKNVTKEEAVKLAHNSMEQAYKVFIETNEYVNGSDSSNETLARIRQKIDNVKYKDELAGYWILEGPYEILVDKSTGDLFFKYGTGKDGENGSYFEGIYAIDVNDTHIFTRGYFAG